MQVSPSDCFLYNAPVALLQVLFHQLDISDAKSVEDLRDFISELGGIDLLVNNAGMAFPLSDPTPFKEQARRTVDSWWQFPSQANGCSHKHRDSGSLGKLVMIVVKLCQINYIYIYICNYDID